MQKRENGILLQGKEMMHKTSAQEQKCIHIGYI